MLRCALDVRRSSIRLVLFGFWGDGLPARLETRLLLSRNSSRVLDILEMWSHWYALDKGPERVVVGCRAECLAGPPGPSPPPGRLYPGMD